MQRDIKKVIRLQIIDHSFARISNEDKKLLEPFTRFRVPGAHYSKLYKEKKWDGTVSLIKRSRVPLGMLSYLMQECQKRSITIEFVADRQSISQSELREAIFDPPIMPTSDLENLLKLLPSEVKPRFYQIDSFMAATTIGRGLIVLPTGAGKSLNIYMMAYMLSRQFNIGLIIVPRIDLVDQLARDLRYFSQGTINPLTTSEDGLGVMGLLKDKENIIISTWQSWRSWMKSSKTVVPDYILIDEAHTVACKEMPWDFMEEFCSTKYRYGFTATENEFIADRITLQGLLGPVIFREKPETLIETNFLARPFIHRINIEHKVDKKWAKKSELVRRPERMKLLIEVIHTVLPENKSILVLTDVVQEEIVPFSEMFKIVMAERLSKGEREADYDVYTLSSASSNRKPIIEAVANPQKKTVLCVTYGLFQMGINIPSLQHILFFAPSQSYIRVLQSIGRGLRPKDFCHVYDISDFTSEKAAAYDEPDESMTKRLSIYKSAYGDNMDMEEVTFRI